MTDGDDIERAAIQAEAHGGRVLRAVPPPDDWPDPTDADAPDAPPSEQRVKVETRDGVFTPTADAEPLVRLGDCAADALAMVERRRAGEEIPIPLPWPDLA